MLRITESDRDGLCTLRLEGSLTALLLAELQVAMSRGCGGKVVHRLDLAGLVYLDGPSAVQLAALRAHGVVIEGCSPFVAGLLSATGVAQAPRHL